jgi:hypothetical protein
VKVAETDRQVAEERAANAERHLQSLHSPTPAARSNRNCDGAAVMADGIGSQGKDTPASASALSGDDDDSEVEAHKYLTENVPPPIKFSRPRAGAGPALKATFKPQPLFVSSPSPEPDVFMKAVGGMFHYLSKRC